MGHNRSGDNRRQRLRRSKRELERLARKSSPEPRKDRAARKSEPGQGGK